MIKFVKRLRFLFNVRRSVPFLVDFFRSRDVSLAKKGLSVGVVAFYFWLPMDVIPDVFLILGVVDDLAVFTFILQMMVKMAPEELQKRYHIS
ncbi:YkvA family protein [Rossellomorea arthrocnemi]|jgi:uncharacterized membrane protein YkvA (DUF1232 family)|uniref:YkvA family protein n=1 Tax=Rossellomorea arthrocnemi TaxID=2769542 RepID=UPI0019183E29|nr:DUF1232 domain-containing protein [Rossellomorea arthrocnemi]